MFFVGQQKRALRRPFLFEQQNWLLFQRTGRGRLLGDLSFADFLKRLAVDAESRRWPGFESFDANLDTAAIAIAVVTTFNLSDGFFYFLDQLALTITITQFDRNVGFLTCPVIGVGKDRRFILHGMNRTLNVVHQLSLERFEDGPEMSQLSAAHVFLTLFGNVGGEMFVE